jgi:hypothetical protein
LQKSNRVTVTTDSFEMLRQTVFTLVWEGPSTKDLVSLEGVSLVCCFNRCGMQGVRSIWLLSGWFSWVCDRCKERTKKLFWWIYGTIDIYIIGEARTCALVGILFYSLVDNVHLSVTWRTSAASVRFSDSFFRIMFNDKWHRLTQEKKKLWHPTTGRIWRK